ARSAAELSIRQACTRLIGAFPLRDGNRKSSGLADAGTNVLMASDNEALIFIRLILRVLRSLTVITPPVTSRTLNDKMSLIRRAVFIPNVKRSRLRSLRFALIRSISRRFLIGWTSFIVKSLTKTL